MKNMKRVLSLILCLMMVITAVPMGAVVDSVKAFADEVSAASTNEVIDAAIFFSDLHAMYNGDSSTGDTGYKKDKVTSTFTLVKNTGLSFSSVTSVGDAFSSNERAYTGKTSIITGYIRDALGDQTIPVNYAWSDHDRAALAENDTDLVANMSGLIYGAGPNGQYGDSDDANYYVYAISMSDMSSAERYSQPSTFTEQKLEDFKDAIDDLDPSKPIFIASHQPLLAKRNDNQYAYKWATVINEVAETHDVAFFFGHNHNYDVENCYYAAKGTNLTVQNGGSTKSVKLNFPHICAGYFDPATTGYAGSSRQGTVMLVTIYEDEINYTTYCKTGEYKGTNATNETVERINKVTLPETPEIETVTLTDEPTGVKVSALGITGLTVNKIEDTTEISSKISSVLNIEKGLSAFDITVANFTEGDEATVIIPVPAGVDADNFAVYYVPADGKIERMPGKNLENGFYQFTTTHFSEYVGGEIRNYDWVEIKGENKTIFRLTNSLSSGEKYVIVSSNKAGNANATKLTSSNGVSSYKIESTPVDVKSSGDVIYIEAPDNSAQWTYTSNQYFQNVSESRRYLRGHDSTLVLTTSPGKRSSYSIWSYDNGLIAKENGNSNKMRYMTSVTSTSSSPSTSNRVYIYVEDTLKTTSGYACLTGHTAPSIELIEGEDLITEDTIRDNIKVYYSTDKIASEDALKEDYTIIWKNSDGTEVNFEEIKDEAGSYVGEVYYQSTHLGDINLTISEKIIEKLTVERDYVEVERNEDISDEKITLTVKYRKNNEVITEEVNLTDLKLVDADGKNITISTSKSGTFTGYVLYNGKKSENTFTLKVKNIPGLNDYPEYPNEGSIRIDKSATAVGDFSQTGIALIELAMTGVPFTTGNRIDVVLMLDRSSSMYKSGVQHRISTTVEATQEFVKTVVKNEDGTFNGNRILILDFLGGNLDRNEGGGSSHQFQSNQYTTNEESGYQVINSQAELDALLNKIEDEFKGQTSLYGTEYAQGLEICYNALNASREDGNKQYCVFMSDGIPNYMMGEKTHFKKTDNIVGMFDVTNYTAATAKASRNTTKYEYEHYSTLMKNEGVTVYTVGLGLENTNSAWGSASKEACGQVAEMLLNDISGPAYEKAADRDTGSAVSKKGTYFFSVSDDEAATEMATVFEGISKKILEAATDAHVEDKVGNKYSLNISMPLNVDIDDTKGQNEFYIQVVDYVLDENKERKGNPAVLENFTFNADGTLKSHTVDGKACTNCNHVTNNAANITGTYFNYVKNDDGEIFKWNADKISSTELALQYFVHLDNSTEVGPAYQVPAGTYYTNEYAKLTYTNYLGNLCEKEFPVPQMSWKGAQVTYVFYLVDKNGNPVNNTGNIIPFNEAVYVTQPITKAVTWNDSEQVEELNAKYLADDVLPEGYTLYDPNAYFEILVFETEGVDDNPQNKNRFIIEGSDNLTNLNTTKVYNTKAGTKYSAYGAYSAKAGTYTCRNPEHETNPHSREATVTTDIHYANVTVAFAVVWVPDTIPDAVVVDFGLPVDIHVLSNDQFGDAGTLVGIEKTPTDESKQHKHPVTGDTQNAITTTEAAGTFGSVKIYPASLKDEAHVRYTFNEKNMQMNTYEKFTYSVKYPYKESENATAVNRYFYGDVTIIPATTIYYEDGFLSYQVSGTAKWVDVTDDNKPADIATQAEDRPGYYNFDKIDANNVYGFDGAYTEMSKYSLGSSKMVHVSKTDAGINSGRATFSFYGTGFDVISLTSNTTGMVIVKVYEYNKDDNGKYLTTYNSTPVKDYIVDTFYGMKADGTIEKNNPETIYQVPVMKIEGLNYSKYFVTITASYQELFDHNQYLDTSYDFYLDAIRIYDPAGTQYGTDDSSDGKLGNLIDATIKDAYIADNEADPQYSELRNMIIDAKTFDISNKAEVPGLVFIDSNVSTDNITEYTNFGPNNELYLAKGQAIAFKVKFDTSAADVQIALKVANGETVTYEINGNRYTTNSATDLYKSILTEAKTGTVTIKNVSDGILSITNIKITSGDYTATPTMELFMDGPSTARVLMMMRPPVAEEPEVDDTTSTPETDDTTTSEPETSEPEDDTTSSEPETSEPEDEPENEKPESNKDKAEKELKKALEKAAKELEKVMKKAAKEAEKAAKKAQNALKKLFGR